MPPCPTFRRLSATLALGLITALAQPGFAQDATPAADAQDNVDPGAYLSALYAATQGDFGNAADYFSRALISDPTNLQMQEGALVAQIARDEIGRARAMAGAMPEPARTRLVPHLLTVTGAAGRGDYQAAMTALDAARDGDTGPDDQNILDGLMRAWALIGMGQMSDATAAFDSLGKTEGIAAISRYHKALALASVGDFEGADALLSTGEGGSLSHGRRGLVAHAEILSQLDRKDDALALLDKVLEAGDDPVLQDLRDRIATGEPQPFSIVRKPADGLSEVLFGFSGAMVGGDVSDTSGLIYARLAAELNPANFDANIVAASLLEDIGQHDLAIAAFRRIDPAIPAGLNARLGVANALMNARRRPEAVAEMQALTADRPGSAIAWLTLGDMLRATNAYTDSAAAYDKAIGLDEAADKTPPWYAFYARGIANERAGQFDRAEPDFRRALELSPGQPEVQNYLGYSFVDRNENLDEALELIRQAVAARPDDGYIQDSLGWAFYRLGRYDEAVAPMEAAVIRMSEDPLVNDHLGDVYWAVGRKREAGVQWRRALSLLPGAETSGEVDPDRIRKKLEVGLDQVLADEGAKPLHDAN